MINKIVPTILSEDKSEFGKLLRMAEKFTDYAQIDIMDGEFAPTKSVTAEDVKAAAPKLKFEVDLMVNNPRKYISDFEDAGAIELDFYLESSGDNIQDLISETKQRGMKVGLTTLPETPLLALHEYAQDLDSIRFFSGHLGYYGGEFNQGVLVKVREARRKWPNMILSIDGGVTLENIKTIKEAGINYFAVGSRIMKAENPAAEFKKFQEAVA